MLPRRIHLSSPFETMSGGPLGGGAEAVQISLRSAAKLGIDRRADRRRATHGHQKSLSPATRIRKHPPPHHTVRSHRGTLTPRRAVQIRRPHSDRYQITRLRLASVALDGVQTAAERLRTAQRCSLACSLGGPLIGFRCDRLDGWNGEGFRMPFGVRKPPKHEPAGLRRGSMGISTFGRAR